MADYVNRRLGPVITRGPNATVGVPRPLDPALYLPAQEQMRTMPRYSSASRSLAPPRSDPAAADLVLATWQNLGPANQGGRTRAFIIHPTDPNIMYAGGVAGGVWKSTDAGANWTAMSDLLMGNLAVVTLAFDPTDPNTIYAGTGEGFFNADAIRGAGIFRSLDAGGTWAQMASTNNTNFHYTMHLIVSPRNNQRIFAATRAGVFRSLDGGTSWTSLISGAAVNGCTDLAVQRTGPTGYVFAACGTFTQATVYRAADDDVSTFVSVQSLPGQGRSSIAIAPSDETVVYILAAQNSAGGGPGVDGLHSVSRSTTSGAPGSFVVRRSGTVAPANVAERINQLLLSNPVYGLLADCGFGTSQFFNQGWYDNTIAVDPLDPNRVWVGGIDLWRSDDGGTNWGTASFWWFGKGDPPYSHADQHRIVFHPQYNGTTNKVLFALSDGGVSRTSDARAAVSTTLAEICGTPSASAVSWVDRSNGYVTTQFYEGVVHPNGSSFFGGLQDNGTLRGTAGNPNWAILQGGDGGSVALDTQNDGNTNNDVLFAEFTGLSIQKSVNNGATFSSAVSGITDSFFAFIAPFTMNEGNRQQMWTGGGYLWRTTNQATTWTRASALTCGNGSVSAIAVHPADGNRVLAGMSDGYILYNTAALSATSATAWACPRPATAAVSSVAWDPANTSVAYAAVSRFGAATLYKTTDAGVSWTASVGSGATALPQVPALAVVVNPADAQQVYVGTDLGVFVSIDGGASWLLENTGFANAPVESLRFTDTAPRRLFAFTHGRGAWSVGTGCPTITVAPGSLPGGTVGTGTRRPCWRAAARALRLQRIDRDAADGDYAVPRRRTHRNTYRQRHLRLHRARDRQQHVCGHTGLLDHRRTGDDDHDGDVRGRTVCLSRHGLHRHRHGHGTRLEPIAASDLRRQLHQRHRRQWLHGLGVVRGQRELRAQQRVRQHHHHPRHAHDHGRQPHGVERRGQRPPGRHHHLAHRGRERGHRDLHRAAGCHPDRRADGLGHGHGRRRQCGVQHPDWHGHRALHHRRRLQPGGELPRRHCGRGDADADAAVPSRHGDARDAAERRLVRQLCAGAVGQRRNTGLHLRRHRGRAARRPDADGRGAVEWHAHRERHVQPHGDRHRCERVHRRSGLCAHHRPRDVDDDGDLRAGAVCLPRHTVRRHRDGHRRGWSEPGGARRPQRRLHDSGCRGRLHRHRDVRRRRHLPGEQRQPEHHGAPADGCPAGDRPARGPGGRYARAVPLDRASVRSGA